MIQSAHTQSIENIEKGIKRAGEQLIALIPRSVYVQEGYEANVSIEWPTGQKLTANEKSDVILNYDYGKNQPFKLKLGLDSNGNISASIYDLLKIFGVNWNVVGTIEFDSNGNLKTAQSFYNYVKSYIAKFWK